MEALFATFADAAQTRAAGRRVAAALPAGLLVGLSGPLGAGKTTFVQGVAEGLGVAGPVQSPTYVLVREYGVVGGAHPNSRGVAPDPIGEDNPATVRVGGVAPLQAVTSQGAAEPGLPTPENPQRTSAPSRLVHADLYRLGPADVEHLALDETADEGALVLVEWPDRAGAALQLDLRFEILPVPGTERETDQPAPSTDDESKSSESHNGDVEFEASEPRMIRLIALSERGRRVCAQIAAQRLLAEHEPSGAAAGGATAASGASRRAIADAGTGRRA